MANINSLFEVKKSGDQEVVMRFPRGIEVGANLDASTLLKGMVEMALNEEPDVAGQTGVNSPCWGDGPSCGVHTTPQPYDPERFKMR